MSDAQKEELIQKTFRRNSLTDHGVEKIEAFRVSGLLGQMGQKYDDKKLGQWLKKLDPKNTGYLDHEAYNQLCKEFVKDPAMLAQTEEGNKFSFKQLITPADLD